MSRPSERQWRTPIDGEHPYVSPDGIVMKRTWAGEVRNVSLLVAIGVSADAHVAETLTYYAFPDCHCIKIRTNNSLERIMREIRRRYRVVGAFPDGQSCLNLAAARLRHIAGT